MNKQLGLTITELIIVLAIIAALLSLLLPAVLRVRNSARETACKNNLRQIYIATAQLVETTKKVPPKSEPGKFGGWMVAILPMIDQANLGSKIPIGSNITASAEFNRPPSIYQCPVRLGMERELTEGMWPSHYILSTGGDRKYFSLSDAPVSLREPWGSSPEMPGTELRRTIGPHHDGFFHIMNQLHGVQFLEGNQPPGEN